MCGHWQHLSEDHRVVANDMTAAARPVEPPLVAVPDQAALAEDPHVVTTTAAGVLDAPVFCDIFEVNEVPAVAVTKHEGVQVWMLPLQLVDERLDEGRPPMFVAVERGPVHAEAVEKPVQHCVFDVCHGGMYHDASISLGPLPEQFNLRQTMAGKRLTHQ